MFQQIDPAMLQQRLASPSPPVLLDVRTADEHRRARLADSRHIPLHELPVRIGELDPATPLVIYCLSGGRSAQACMYLARQGFSDLANLSSGIAGWAQSGLPYIEGD